jgi:hypothetical protein
MRILYLDCFAGISGDMMLAALEDAGADREYIETELQKIRIEPFSLEWRTVMKKGISARKVDVVVPEDHKPHHHRHYSEIVELIRNAGFNEKVTAMSLAVFAKIGEAEAKIHNTPLENVHFHEVGAIDSIVDIIGAALALDSLQVDRIVSAPVPLGSGTIRCDHGVYPVPAPATLEIMRGLPIAASDHRMELTTPTGAGIAAALVQAFTPSMPPMTVERIGYGAGTRDLPNHPNVLRVVVGESDHGLKPGTDTLRAHGHAHTHHHGHGHHPHDHGHGHGHGHDHHHHSHHHDHGHIHGHDHHHDHHHDHSRGHEHDHHHHSHHHDHSRGHEHDHHHRGHDPAHPST